MARRAKTKRWSDLSGEQRAAIGVAGAVQVGLLVTALVDLWRRPSDQVNGSKLLWVPICFVNFIGPLAYLRFGRTR